MAIEIVVDFEKVYPSGVSVKTRFSMPAEGSHVLVLFGPSGAGKTTILRCMAGLDHPDRGGIRFGNTTWFDSEQAQARSPQSRSIGYLFQDYALFPHLTVGRNIAYGIEKTRPAEKEERVREMLRILRIEEMRDRLPGELSGGQQQRVALARALVRRPQLLLLDEPLSALDVQTRNHVRDELRTLLRTLEIPALCVTHDWTEALALADQVAVLSKGSILQMGPPNEVFSRPANADVAAIVGVETVVLGHVESRQDGLVALRIGEVRLWALEETGTHKEYYVCIRAENVAVETDVAVKSSIRNHLPCRIRDIRSSGAISYLILDCGFDLTALLTNQAAQELALRPDQKVIASIKAASIHLIPRG